MNAITITLRGNTARALDHLVYANNAETAIQLVAQHLLAEGMNADLPVRILEHGWRVVDIPTLRAAANAETFTPALVRKLVPHNERKHTHKRSHSLWQSA